MTTILLTGIPKIGKGDLIETTRQLSQQFFERPVETVSLGELVAEQAYQLWATPPNRLPNLDYTLQQALRKYAISEASRQLQKLGLDEQQAALDEMRRTIAEENKQAVKNIRQIHDALHEDGKTTLPKTIELALKNAEGTTERIEEAVDRQQRSLERHIIIDTPLTMFLMQGEDNKNTIPDIIFSQADISMLHQARTIDYVLTVIDDAYALAERFQHGPYPSDPEKILDWIALEVGATKSVIPYKIERVNGKDIRQIPRRHIVIPKESSEETMVKLLNDPNPPIVYLAGPITKLKQKADDSQEVREKKEADRKKMRDFGRALQEYAVVVEPMEMADGKITPTDIANTVFRDLHWFVKNADIVVAYFPGDYASTGTTKEMDKTLDTGKPVILIHPSTSREVFGIRPTFHYTTEKDFFDNVVGSRRYHKDDPRYETLRWLLDPNQEVPRYASLQKYAVAVDIEREGRHLLGLQAKGKGYAGHWMLIAGKKEPDAHGNIIETDFDALVREVWQEVGIKLLSTQPGYKLHRVNYAKPGSGVRYVRIYHSLDTEGKIREDNVTRHPEIERAEFFTIDDILKEGKVVPATREYFEALQQQRTR